MKIAPFQSQQQLDLLDLPGEAERELTLKGWGIRVQAGGAGMVWHRPRLVEVRQQGRVRRVPIRDATLWAMLGLWLATLAMVGLVEWQRRQSEQYRSGAR